MATTKKIHGLNFNLLKALSTWHIVRWIFLVLGIMLAVFAYRQYDAALGLLSIFIIYQAILNVGCVKMCYAWQRWSKAKKDVPASSDEITYEEIL